ncbi:MAG: TlyA family RNA methyltransferase [Salinispira sp.]
MKNRFPVAGKSGKSRKSGAAGTRSLLEIVKKRFPMRKSKELYAHILYGDVFVNGHRERNLSARISPDAEITIAPTEKNYVSRGGHKLESILRRAENAGFCYRNRVLLDAGASSGGFTDCLLQHGAQTVHTVDVGYNQLDYRLRCDSRVQVHERCNIMSISREDMQPCPEFAVADISFRTLSGVVPHILKILCSDDPLLLALIKPQFELEYSDIPVADFSGVLRDSSIIEGVLDNLIGRLREEGVRVGGMWPSGLPGKKGNQEFFGLFSAQDTQ